MPEFWHHEKWPKIFRGWTCHWFCKNFLKIFAKFKTEQKFNLPQTLPSLGARPLGLAQTLKNLRLLTNFAKNSQGLPLLGQNAPKKYHPEAVTATYPRPEGILHNKFLPHFFKNWKIEKKFPPNFHFLKKKWNRKFSKIYDFWKFFPKIFGTKIFRTPALDQLLEPLGPPP